MERYPIDAMPMIQARYAVFAEKHREFRKKLGRPLTLTEKILFAHWVGDGRNLPTRGKSTEPFQVDRVAMQDATAQMAILQFISSGRREAAVPSTVHCDHLIRAKVGADKDLPAALDTNRQVYDFLQSACAKYGMGFWKPGAGIIHQVVLENYAFPGGMMIGTDSHTPNAGGLGMIACGVGGADAVDAMVGMAWEVLWPKLVGVKLTGKLDGWTSGKDVILKLASILTVKGGTGRIVEYFGPGTRALSCTAKGTICNMGAEIGATTSLFPFDDRMAAYLRATERADLAKLAESHAAELTADPDVFDAPEKFYDQVIEIDLSTLEPHIVGPHTPDLARPVSDMARDVAANKYPERISAALIGSCTNSSYEDIGRAAHIARQARAKGLKAKVPFLVTPGSEQIRATIERDGLLKDLEDIGAVVLANACGPCIGQWERTDLKEGTPNSILTSYNRNFPKRNDGRKETCAFIGSPEVVTAYALTGTFLEDPIHDGVKINGKTVKLEPPQGDELPKRGFAKGEEGYIAPAEKSDKIQVSIDPKSERLAMLEPFENVDKKIYRDMPVLMKSTGKTTTDHISPAGPWLKFRGHLDKISDNMFLGVNNVFSPGEAGTGFNVLTGQAGENLSKIARAYKSKNLGWVAVGDENYGEGSSREHAAMEPRFLNGRVVLARSFARIHETNLKKQGILAITFADSKDYDLIRHDDRVDFPDADQLTPGKPVSVVIKHADGKQEHISANHSYTADQIRWFQAGSALNLIRQGQ